MPGPVCSHNDSDKREGYSIRLKGAQRGTAGPGCDVPGTGRHGEGTQPHGMSRKRKRM